MKGWVYVISNRSMPGLVKIGYTMKDPELRASELNGTGVPTPYAVDYEVLVEEPRSIEQKAHAGLSQYREGKEWFRLSAEDAIAGIKNIIGTGAFLENYKNADRMKAEATALQEQQIAEQKRQENERVRLGKRRLEEQKNKILEAERKLEHISKAHKQQRIDSLRNQRKLAQETKYKELEASLPEENFFGIFVIVAFGIGVALALLLPDMDDSGIFWGGVILGLIATPFVLGYCRSQDKQSSWYKALEKKHNDKIAAIDSRLAAEIAHPVYQSR